MGSILAQSGMRRSTIHTLVAGICCGLGIPSDIIYRHGSALEKTKSLGNSKRALKNPTVDVVAKIAGAMGVSVTALFSEERAVAEQISLE